MDNIAIIPARGGSKRILKKNIKMFFGKPIIAYSIENALVSGLFDEVMVSTDDEEIAEVARKYGANVPFLRSEKASDDYATTETVIYEVLNEYKNRSMEFENFCCILSTAPFLKHTLLENSYNKFQNGSFDSLFPAIRYSYPIQRALRVVDGKIKMREAEYLHSRSQDLEPMFHDSGLFYWMKIKEFYKSGEIFCQNTGMIELSELETHDIDDENDWKIAEFKYKMLNG